MGRLRRQQLALQGEHANDPFHLEWVVLTHPDEDHAGGAKEFVGKLGEHWSVGTLFHCGLGRFKGEARPQVPASGGEPEQPGFSQLGPVRDGANGELYLSQLIDGATDVEAFSEPTDNRPWFLSGNYADFLKGAASHVGHAVGEIARLSHRSDGADLSRGGVDVKVLGPVEGAIGDTPALRYLDNNKIDGFYNLKGPSLSRNGHSVVLRLDFGGVRILMTGDLNFRSHALLLQQWPAEEFSCHVGKACYHGSEDISWKFLQAMDPLAVMFSSGDQETHVHPRALALGLSGAFSKRLKRRTSAASAEEHTFETVQFAGFEEPKLFSPLLYSTELSRSARLRTDMKAYKRTQTPEGDDFEDLGGVHFKGSNDDDNYVAHRDVWIVDRLTYGLINVRTDGKKVVIAVLEEGSEPEYHIESFIPSRLVPL